MKAIRNMVMLGIVFTILTFACSISFADMTYKFVELPDGYKTVTEKGYFHSQLLGVKKTTDKGIIYDYVDRDGVLQNLNEYSTGIEFSEGLVPIIKGDKLGYMNTKGEIIIPIMYDYENSQNYYGDPQDDPYLKTGAFNGQVAFVAEKSTYNDQVHYYYKPINLENKKPRATGESNIYSRNKGHQNGEIEVEEVIYEGSKHEVEFINDLGLIYYKKIGKLKDGTSYIEQKGTPIIVQRYHSVRDKEYSLTVDGYKWEYIGYDINGKRYVSLGNFLTFLSKTPKKRGLDINIDEKYVHIFKGTKYSFEKDQLKVENNVVRVPAISILDMYIDNKRAFVTMYIINNKPYINFEGTAKYLDISLIRDKQNNILGIDTSEKYQKPYDPMDDILNDKGQMKSEIAINYIDKSFETLKVINKEGKYYLSITLADLPEEFAWQPSYNVRGKKTICYSVSHKVVNSKGYNEWELKGLKRSDIKNGANLYFSLYNITKDVRSGSVIWEMKSFDPGKVSQYINRGSGSEQSIDYDTSRILEYWK